MVAAVLAFSFVFVLPAMAMEKPEGKEFPERERTAIVQSEAVKTCFNEVKKNYNDGLKVAEKKYVQTIKDGMARYKDTLKSAQDAYLSGNMDDAARTIRQEARKAAHELWSTAKKEARKAWREAIETGRKARIEARNQCKTNQ